MTKNRIVNLILILCGTAATAALACALRYFYTVYYSAGQSPGPGGMAVYLALPALAAVFFFLALKLSPRSKTNLAVLTVTVGVCLFLTELTAGFLTRTESPLLREVRKLRGQGERAFPRVIPRRLFKLQQDNTYLPALHDSAGYLQPLGGISGVETVLCNETDRFVTYRSDAWGFNNPPGLAGQKARVLALGDSFVHGFCVTPERNFVSLIGEKFAPAYNLGSGGNGPLLQLAGLREYGPLSRPDYVLWFFFEGNDLNNLEMESLHLLLKNYLDPGYTQNLASTQPRIDRELSRFLEETMAGEDAGPGSGFKDLIMLRHLRRLLGLGTSSKEAVKESGPRPEPGEPDWPLFERIMLEARRTAADWGGRLILVYLPEQQRFMGTSRASLGQERKTLLEFLRLEGIPVVDLAPVFAARPDSLALFNIPDKPSHYNRSGHALVAREVIRYLESRQDG